MFQLYSVSLKDCRSIWMAEWLALQTLDHKDLGSDLTGGRIQVVTVCCFIAQSLLLSHFRRLNMT